MEVRVEIWEDRYRIGCDKNGGGGGGVEHHPHRYLDGLKNQSFAVMH